MTEKLSILRFTEDGSFWGSKPEELNQLSQVELPTFKNYETNNHKFLAEGDLCLVCCDSGIWKRGKILSLLAGQHGTHAEIFLIDRAHVMTKLLQSCYPLPDDLGRIPPLANLYHLKGLQPCGVTAGQWSEQVMDFLKELNSGSTIKVELEAGNVAILYWMVGDVKINFNECLLHANLARACEEKLFVDDLQSPSSPLSKEKSGNEVNHSEILFSHKDVYVEGSQQLLPWDSLTASSFPISIQKGLLSLGFKTPTTSQANAWPYVWNGCDLVLISPSGSGKTLSYLLPLLANIGTRCSHSKGPLLLVIVGTSWQARSIQMQSKRVLSWLSVEKSLRCCCSYKAIEAQAVVSLINGVDVLVGTPPSILRLLQRGSLSLQTVSKLVLDDVGDLFSKFEDDIGDILSRCIRTSLVQVVITAIEWSQQIHSLMSTYTHDPVLILTSALEALVKVGAFMKIVCCNQKDRFSSIVECLTKGPAVICTSTSEEAYEVQQVSQLNNWPCVNVVSGLELGRMKLMLANSGVIVVSDEMVEDTVRQQSQVSHLLHYSLPSSKLCFQRRLSLLFPSIIGGGKCQCTVVVTQQDRNRSAIFVDYLKRVSQPIPIDLQEIVDSCQKEKDDLRSTYDLCYHLKAWGTCSLNKCPSVHGPVQCLRQCGNGPPPLCLPTNGAVEVKVCHVSNATRLWVTVRKHYPQSQGGQCLPNHDPTKAISLALSLAQFFSEVENRVLEEDIHEGVYCALEDGSGTYFRVRVLKFSQPLGFCFPHKEKARVRLIDYGSVQIVDLNQLLVLPKNLLVLPAQVTEVYLCGIRPLEKDHDWPEEAIELSQNLLEGEVLFGEIAAQCGQTLWLDPVEHRVSLSGIKVNTALCNPVNELIKSGFAERNPEHLLRLKAALGICDHIEVQRDRIRWSSLPLYDSTEVHISAVLDPSNIHVQMTENHFKLNKLEQTLNSCDIVVVSKASLQEGDFCSAQFPLDDKWYRGLIQSRTEEQIEVIFVDYGDCEWVPLNKIQPIDPSLLELPAQAIKCSLGSSDMLWPNNSGDVLWDMTRDATLTARVTGLAPEDGTAFVTITFSDNQRNVCDVLVEKLKSPLIQPLPTGLIDEAVAAVISSESEQLQFAQIIESLMLHNPGYVLENFSELTSLLDNMHKIEDSTCIHVLRGIAASMHLFASALNSFHWILDLLQRNNTHVVVATLRVIKLKLSVTRNLSCENDIIHCLMSLLNNSRADTSQVENVLEIFLLLSKNHMDVIDLVHLAKVCCSYILLEGSSLTSLHLLDILADNEKSASIVRQILSVQAMMESKQFWRKLTTLEQGYILVNILRKLSTDPLYRNQLCCYSLWERFQGDDNNNVFMKLLGTTLNLSFDYQCKRKTLKNVRSIKPIGENMLVCPHVLWSQQKSSILLAVQLRNCSYDNVIVKFEEKEVSFRVELEQQLFGFDLTLAQNIVVEECGFLLTATEVLISLPKKVAEWWPALANKARKLPMFSVDFNRCYTSSSDELPEKERTIVRQNKASSTSSSQCDSSGADADDFIDFEY